MARGMWFAGVPVALDAPLFLEIGDRAFTGPDAARWPVGFIHPWPSKYRPPTARDVQDSFEETDPHTVRPGLDTPKGLVSWQGSDAWAIGRIWSGSGICLVGDVVSLEKVSMRDLRASVRLDASSSAGFKVAMLRPVFMVKSSGFQLAFFMLEVVA